jgi:hypothetical protein
VVFLGTSVDTSVGLITQLIISIQFTKYGNYCNDTQDKSEPYLLCIEIFIYFYYFHFVNENCTSLFVTVKELKLRFLQVSFCYGEASSLQAL